MIRRSKTVILGGRITIPWVCLGLNLIAILPAAAQPLLLKPATVTNAVPSQPNPEAFSSQPVSPEPTYTLSVDSSLNVPVTDMPVADTFVTAALADSAAMPKPVTDEPGLDSSSSTTQASAIISASTIDDSLSTLNYIHAAANPQLAKNPAPELLTRFAQATPLPTVATAIVAVTADECLADCNPTEQFSFNPPIPNIAIPPRSTYARTEVAQTPVLPVPAYPNPRVDQTLPPPPTRSENLAPLPSSELANASPSYPSRAPAFNLAASTPATTAALLTPSDTFSRRAITPPTLQFQGAYLYQGGEDSGRMRVTAVYPILPELQIGGTLEFTEGEVFSASGDDGLAINELYVAAAVPGYPNLRFVAGQLDLTSYFDRNSFAKDSVTQFFNPVFATNPALSATGIGSRQAALVNWTPIDEIEIKAAAFSSDRSISDFEVNGFAAEVGGRLGNLVVRGTYATDRDAGTNTGFDEIYSLQRSNGDFGLGNGDREEAYGINAEYFIPEINLGLFARYGRYENRDLERGATTYSVGLNLLDLFMRDDRLGIAYGQQLSNEDLREGKNPDVFEAFYDFRVSSWLRFGVTFQGLDQFSETIAGFRIRTDFDLVPAQRTRLVNTTTPRRTP